jgi:Domain of unknown function (DUF4406)
VPDNIIFSPSLTAEAQYPLIFQAWKCALGDARIIYCSGPITTGRRWVEALVAGEEDGAKARVMAENCDALRTAAKRLRTEAFAIVVEPASLTVPGWSQDDYLFLWTEMIERHAGEVRFLPDWALSNGCAHEFERALLHGIRTCDLEGQPITQQHGLGLLRDAHDTLSKEARDCTALVPLQMAILSVIERVGNTP